MSALVVCMALVADRVFEFHRRPGPWHWHRRWFDWLGQRGLPAGAGTWTGTALLVVPPVLLVFWLQQVLPFWVVSILGILLLLHAMAARDLYALSDRFIAACRDDDVGAAETAATDIGSPLPVRLDSTPRVLVDAVLHQYLTPLFWALLLGPAGALLVRSCTGWLDGQSAETTELRARLRQILAVLDWIPVRISLLFFGICGNFEAAWRAWRPDQSSRPAYQANVRLLQSIGLSAAGAQAGTGMRQVAENMRAVRGLLLRVLVLMFGLLLLAAIWR